VTYHQKPSVVFVMENLLREYDVREA